MKKEQDKDLGHVSLSSLSFDHMYTLLFAFAMYSVRSFCMAR